MNMESVGSVETSVNFNPVTGLHVPEDSKQSFPSYLCVPCAVGRYIRTRISLITQSVQVPYN
jgi:hypothetical protein